MDKTVSHLEAWEHFYKWVRLPENWKDVDRKGQDRILKAQRRYLHKTPSGLGYEGVKTILTKYAPGRYDFLERVVIRG